MVNISKDGIKQVYVGFLIILVMLFFNNVPVYLENIVNSGITTSKFVLALFILALPIVNSRVLLGTLNNYMLLLYFVLFNVVLIYFIFEQGDMTKFEEVKKYFVRFVFILTISIIFSSDAFDENLFKKILLASVVLCVFSYVVELFNPFLFVPVEHDSANPGRSAGFYIDSNQAGGGLLLALIFSIEYVKKNYRVIFLAFVGIAIILTFSRSSILFFAITCILFYLLGLINKKQSIIALVISMFLFVMLFSDFLYVLEDLLDVGEKNNLRTIMTRIEWFFTPSALDASGSERVQIATLAMNVIAENPIFGSGIAGARDLGLDVSTHNMLLFMGVEFGLVGVMIFISFVILIFLKVKENDIKYSIIITLFVIYWSFFSHNMFDEFHQLIIYTFCCSKMFLRKGK